MRYEKKLLVVVVVVEFLGTLQEFASTERQADRLLFPFRFILLLAWNTETMAGAAAAIWEHEIVLRVHPRAEDDGTKKMDLPHRPQLPVSEFLSSKGWGINFYFCLSQWFRNASMHYNYLEVWLKQR